MVEAETRGLRVRLSVMMAGVYAVQGAWWPLLALHLSDMEVSGRLRGWIFATLAIGSFLTPVAAGQLADRRIAAPRLLCITYALGMLLFVALASGWVVAPLGLFGIFLLYWFICAPGTSLCGTVALRNLPRPATQFGGVRLWGTVGWMATGWLVSGVMLLSGGGRDGQGAFEAFAVASVLSLGFSVYCLTLPRTAPQPRVPGDARPTRFALGPVLNQRPVVFMLALAFCVSLTSPFVYQVVPAYLPQLGLPRGWIALAMSLSQVLEIAALAFLPRMLARLGFRGCMSLGVASWVFYHGLMASHPPLWLALTALPLQGLAVALFHVPGPMFLDTLAPSNLRASTQGLYVMATTGLGNLLGSLLAGELVARAGGVSPVVFLAPVAIDAFVLVALNLGFRWAVRPGRGPREPLSGPAKRPALPLRPQPVASAS